ncbi:MAG: hypothetical protein C7B47_17635 [Sulfobacillus thermosulfidooxidans]|uniref:Uncharacterized protein n=1 Tax=Sulfobacillus thermosulfidooxidans TaxID=28034 RepID=A0A2T2WFB7_SULTH|nr:MAG: hypothetical protein C7B47_17635 [Sulfobacillus thermosulfidooxidans]
MFRFKVGRAVGTMLLAGVVTACGPTHESHSPTSQTVKSTAVNDLVPVPATPRPSHRLALTDPAQYIQQYNTWQMDQMLATHRASNPGVLLTGPGAGTFTLTALNGVLHQRYGGPILPASLTAAGIHQAFPTDGTIQGLSHFVHATYTPLIQAGLFPHMAFSVYQQAFTTAAAYALDAVGNDPAALMTTGLGPARWPGESRPLAAALAQTIGGSYRASNGVAALREYTYDAWGTMSPVPAQVAQSSLIQEPDWSGEDITLPTGLPAPTWTMLLEHPMTVTFVRSQKYTAHHKTVVLINHVSVPVTQALLAFMPGNHHAGRWFVVTEQFGTPQYQWEYTVPSRAH